MGNKNSKIGDYEVDLKSELGEGSFGNVFLGYVKASGEKIAVKRCSMSNQEAMGIATDEIKAMEYIPSHVNIVQLLDFHFHDDHAWIFMEFCELGHLENAMSKHIKDSRGVLEVMLQCTQGLLYLHSLDHPLVHRDLKPQNILFSKHNGRLVAKLADFGLAKVMYADTLLKTVAGTELYMAPEITGEKYTLSVDIFSLGLVFLAMVLYDTLGSLVPISATCIKKGKTMAVGREMILAKAKRRPMPIVVAPNSSDHHELSVVKQIINKMVVYDPDKRLPLNVVELELKELRSVGDGDGGVSADSGVSFSLKSAVSESGGGESILREMMRQTLRRADSEGSGDSAVSSVLSSLSLSLQLQQTLDSLTDRERWQFKIGERVIVDSDESHVRQMQKKHSSWLGVMARYIGADGWVYDVQGNDVYNIKFADGYRYSLCGSVLHSYSGRPVPLPGSQSKFKVGDMVSVISDSKKLQSIQTGEREWDSRMHLARGFGGVVKKITVSGLLVVECLNRDVWKLHPDVVVRRDMSGLPLEDGDQVIICPSRALLKKEMKTCGLEWDTEVEKCLDSSGTVIQVLSATVTKVKTEGLRLKLPTSVLSLYGKKDEILKAKMVKKVVEEAARTVKSKS